MKRSKIFNIQVFCISLLSIFCASAQETEASFLLSEMAKQYQELEEYAFELEYKMYKTYAKNILKEAYTTQVFKTKENFRMHLDDYDMYVFDKLQLTIVENNKQIFVNHRIFDTNSAVMLQSIEKIKNTSTVELIEKTNSSISIKLTPKDSGFRQYKTIEMKMALPSYKMLSQTIYFNQEVPYKNEKGQVENSKPCLELKVKDYKGPKVSFLKIEDVLIPKGDSYEATLNYKNYKLTDQRQ